MPGNHQFLFNTIAKIPRVFWDWVYTKISDSLDRIHLDDVIRQHYSDVIMGAMASPITSLTIVYSTVYSGADQRKHQSSASLAFVPGPVNSPHKRPVTWKIFYFMASSWFSCSGWCDLLTISTPLLMKLLSGGYLLKSQHWFRCKRVSIHYLNQFWPTPMSPNGFTRPQGVEIQINIIFHKKFRTRDLI